ncbi:hypothetical protein AB0L57_31490 [Nocardia sp. NPDC052254]|uniref:hypothetical protein n=1 Tax=Nocardia sp. NPDC052254 TaxID=3155681 RepID=UPI0034433C63
MFDPLADIDRALADRAGWTWFDDHLRYTCGVLDLLRRGEMARLPAQSTRIRLDPREMCLAEGPGRWSFWRAAGDGTWEPNNIFVAGSAAFVAAAQLSNALANEARRQRAAAGAQPRWIAERPGSVMISNRRIHLGNPDHVFAIRLSTIETIDLTAPDRVVARYARRNGTLLQWQLQSPWAVLFFVVAAQRYFPNHPLLVSGNWLPAGFEEKCHLAGKSCPKVRER